MFILRVRAKGDRDDEELATDPKTVIRKVESIEPWKDDARKYYKSNQCRALAALRIPSVGTVPLLIPPCVLQCSAAVG